MYRYRLPGVGCTSKNLGTGVSADGMFADGGNSHGYLGANPWINSDPTGLYFTLLELLTSVTIGGGLDADWAHDTKDFGDNLKEVSNLVLGIGAMHQEADIGWAMDWSRSDSDYSGAPSLESGESEIEMSPFGNPMEGQSQASIGRDNHIVPKFLGGALGRARKLMILLSKAAHLAFHTRLNDVLRAASFNKGGKIDRAGREYWMALMKKSPAARKEIKQILIDVTKGMQRDFPQYKKERWAKRLEELLKEVDSFK